MTMYMTTTGIIKFHFTEDINAEKYLIQIIKVINYYQLVMNFMISETP